MIHLAFVVGIGVLIFRVIWLFFGILQKVFTRQPSTQSDKKDQASKSKSTSKSQKPVAAPKRFAGSGTEFQVVAEPIKKQPAVVQNEYQYNQDSSSVSYPQKMIKQYSMPPEQTQTKAEQFKQQKKEQNSKIEEVRQTGNKSQYEERIQLLTQELQKSKKEKHEYLQKIEQIIENIIDQSQRGQESRCSTEEEELFPPIGNLRNQLNSAKQRLVDQRKQLTQEFQQQKRQIVTTYERKIQSILQGHESKTNQYIKNIDEISKKLQHQVLQYNALIQDKSMTSGDISTSNQQLKQFYQKQSQAHNSAYQMLNQNYNSLKEEYQTFKAQVQRSKFDLGRKSNDEIELKAKLQAQIKALQEQNKQIVLQLNEEKKNKFNLEQQIEQLNFKHQHQKITSQNNQNSVHEASAKISALQQNYLKQKNLRQQQERKSSQTLEQLKFCQQQLKNARETQTELRQKLNKASVSPQRSDRSFIRKQDVQRHPQYLSLKRRLQQFEGKRLSPDNVQKRNTVIIGKSPSGRQERQVSPSFPVSNIQDSRNQKSPISETRGHYRSGLGSNYQAFQSKQLNSQVPSSTIMVDRRYNTPIQKPVAYSSINEGGIVDEVYLGQTNILDQAQRNFIMHEISQVKKIVVKRTRMIYNSTQKVNKPISEYMISIPNMIVIAELENKKIVGAFTQNAFSKENRMSRSSIVSKAVLFSLQTRSFITNQGKGDIIRYENNSLVWGNKQFVLKCEQPITISVNLNCENAIYPSDISTKQFMGGVSEGQRVSKLEAHRVLFG